jgi:hypothetical protein
MTCRFDVVSAPFDSIIAVDKLLLLVLLLETG